MAAVILASTTTTIAVIGLVVITLAWIVYAIFNVAGGRKEVGSEIELAANRKPYYDDETLEGPRLERVQLMGVLLLVVIVVALPLYWVFEPSRQAGAEEGGTTGSPVGDPSCSRRPPRAGSTAPAATAVWAPSAVRPRSR